MKQPHPPYLQTVSALSAPSIFSNRNLVNLAVDLSQCVAYLSMSRSGPLVLLIVGVRTGLFVIHRSIWLQMARSRAIAFAYQYPSAVLYSTYPLPQLLPVILFVQTLQCVQRLLWRHSPPPQPQIVYARKKKPSCQSFVSRGFRL